MAEESSSSSGLMYKMKLAGGIGAGILLLWFLVANLWTPAWKLSLWPIAYLEAPGTLFIFVFLLIGASIGFVLCFFLLRSGRLDAALTKLVEERKLAEQGKENRPADEPGEEGTA